MFRCPRCGRRGVVSVMTFEDDPGFDTKGHLWLQVDWESRAGRKTDRDTMVTLDDLNAPDFGCGYDYEPCSPNEIGNGDWNTK